MQDKQINFLIALTLPMALIMTLTRPVVFANKSFTISSAAYAPSGIQHRESEASLTITISWEGNKIPVDLYLQNDMGLFCDRFNRKMSFGQWQRIPRKINPKPNQAIIQDKIVPGTYKLYANIGERTFPATPVDILIVFNPEEGEGSKVVNKKGIMITPSPAPYLNRSDTGTFIGEIQLTETTFNFIPAI